MLWGRAAGRCEFAGCNKVLSRSSVTQEQVNTAQKAHIYSFSADGSRGHAGVAAEELNDLGNLILVCHECHAKMDQHKDGGRYTVELLQAMKAEHERRIDVVAAITRGMTSHIVLYGANIGGHGSPLNYAEAALALFPGRYPAEDRAIELGMVDSSLRDSSDAFWTVESDSLGSKFDQRIRERLVRGDVAHLSVFALAPQPLLVLLGTLLGDLADVQVFQRHREPEQTWRWPANHATQEFQVHEPGSGAAGPPALVLALSATITRGRITGVLGDEAAIWMVTIPEPNNEFTKSREQLSKFRSLTRRLLDKIKARHGQTTPLHIFPATSVSTAVELGRVRMPKADAPWRVYDQVNQRGGFMPALDIPRGE